MNGTITIGTTAISEIFYKDLNNAVVYEDVTALIVYIDLEYYGIYQRCFRHFTIFGYGCQCRSLCACVKRYLKAYSDKN